MITSDEYVLTQDDFKLVSDVVYQHCGISLTDQKFALVQARVAKEIRLRGYTSAREYLDHVLDDRGSPAFAGFIDAISTNLTSFFRESQHFDYLADTYLPALLAKKRQSGIRRLVAWSAACSSGEEPYSMAMTLLDAVGKMNAEPVAWDIRLLATDISTAMLTQARRGTYAFSRLGGIPGRLRTRYLQTAPTLDGEAAMQVTPELQSIVRFRHLNLMNPWPFAGPFDFIFCRNVMIYFDKPTQQRLVERFWQCLRPGGLLFTGHSESLMGIEHRFMHLRASIYERSAS